MSAFVYALKNGVGEIFYVGATKDLKRRMREHRKTFGHAPHYQVLEECLDDWRDAEHEWIRFYRSQGAQLMNRTTGRNGVLALDEHSRRKLSLAIKGRAKSPEHRAKISASQRGMPRGWSPEGEARIRAMQFKPGQDPHAYLPKEIRDRITAGRREKALALTADERARRNRKAWASYTPEQRAERGRRIREGQLRARARREAQGA